MTGEHKVKYTLIVPHIQYFARIEVVMIYNKVVKEPHESGAGIMALEPVDVPGVRIQRHPVPENNEAQGLVIPEGVPEIGRIPYTLERKRKQTVEFLVKMRTVQHFPEPPFAGLGPGYIAHVVAPGNIGIKLAVHIPISAEYDIVVFHNSYAGASDVLSHRLAVDSNKAKMKNMSVATFIQTMKVRAISRMDMYTEPGNKRMRAKPLYMKNNEKSVMPISPQ